MAFLSRPISHHRYIRIVEGSNSDTSVQDGLQYARKPQSTRKFLVYGILWVAVAAAVSFFAGRYSVRLETQDLPHSSPSLQTFRYNRTYVRAPSGESNAAWQNLFPVGGGFIKDSDSATNMSCLSVFHQLHCLDGLRHGYYAALQKPELDDSKEQAYAQAHARHCFDYLRQSIMCSADTTLEHGNVTLNGVTGFGTTHQCRDYGGVVRWTENRRPIAEHSPA